jgi:hypothetical protein
MLKPFWIEPDRSPEPDSLGLGVGITASSEADAREIFERAFGQRRRIVAIKTISDIAELDQQHVVPDMGNWLRRGVWFPMLLRPD